MTINIDTMWKTAQQFKLITDVETLKAQAPLNLRLLCRHEAPSQKEKDLIEQVLADTEWLENLISPLISLLPPRRGDLYGYEVFYEVAKHSPLLSQKLKVYMVASEIKVNPHYTQHTKEAPFYACLRKRQEWNTVYAYYEKTPSFLFRLRGWLSLVSKK